jgi:hypothetical protein
MIALSPKTRQHLKTLFAPVTSGEMYRAYQKIVKKLE